MNFLLDHDVPDDIGFCLEALGHRVCKLRECTPRDTADDQVLRLAVERASVLVTCNRDDFLSLAEAAEHRGIIILIRRRSRVLERAAIIRLLDSAGPQGIEGNITFA